MGKPAVSQFKYFESVQLKIGQIKQHAEYFDKHRPDKMTQTTLKKYIAAKRDVEDILLWLNDVILEYGSEYGYIMPSNRGQFDVATSKLAHNSPDNSNIEIDMPLANIPDSDAQVYNVSQNTRTMHALYSAFEECNAETFGDLAIVKLVAHMLHRWLKERHDPSIVGTAFVYNAQYIPSYAVKLIKYFSIRLVDSYSDNSNVAPDFLAWLNQLDSTTKYSIPDYVFAEIDSCKCTYNTVLLEQQLSPILFKDDMFRQYRHALEEEFIRTYRGHIDFDQYDRVIVPATYYENWKEV